MIKVMPKDLKNLKVTVTGRGKVSVAVIGDSIDIDRERCPH